MEEESWEASLRRHHEGGIWGIWGASGRALEASVRHLGGTWEASKSLFGVPILEQFCGYIVSLVELFLRTL